MHVTRQVSAAGVTRFRCVCSRAGIVRSTCTPDSQFGDSAARRHVWLLFLRIICFVPVPLVALLIAQQWVRGGAAVLLSLTVLSVSAAAAGAAASETLVLLPHVGIQLESTSLWCVRTQKRP